LWGGTGFFGRPSGTIRKIDLAGNEKFMIDEMEVLKIVITRLESAGLHYMVTGSIAANFYTTPRMTRDIDIVIELGEKDIEKFQSLFSGDFYVDQESLRHAFYDKGIFNIIHTEGIVKVDFIVRKETEYRKLEFERRRTILFEGISLNVTSPEDLVLSKLYWAKESLSEIQLRDVRNLLKTTPDMDWGYVEEWVEKLGLDEVFKEARK
jgi:hypothetical protein